MIQIIIDIIFAYYCYEQTTSYCNHVINIVIVLTIYPFRGLNLLVVQCYITTHTKSNVL